MTNPTAAFLVIGDEILSGRTRDANVNRLAVELSEAGIDLSEVRIVPDVHDRIVTALNALRSQYDQVFTSGGIGPTHDDITADAIAAAFGVEISVREDARALLEGRSATDVSRLLKHRSMAVTTIYLHATDEGEEETVGALGRRYGRSMNS